ncbi:putative cobalt transporter CbtA [Nocardioides ginsengisegetis]|uniref:Putative cobalt transporter CbtA n=1 Tax=Nocardioides ginsengisegetis TaxID=661491 RepID=A0A7W3IY58_9ACTN|nr:CbtA family protein [Nocardioides ginsengisegetis]MBA8802775.1 putative cobalt transporter CbtA [Nocardioides ginsengisegetis]
MTPRAFLLRGLLAGLLAGIATFVVAFTVGEPHVQAAIDVEEAHTAAATDHHDEPELVSRDTQRTWGLLTASLAIGTALGGLVGLVSAGVVGRLGRLTPGQSTALVAVAGWVAVTLVPFLKYPASPPAVGDPDTIGQRTTLFFVFLLVSVVAAAASIALGNLLHATRGAYVAVLAGTVTYLALMVATGLVMPSVNEVGDFPADTLWYFRRASLVTNAALWAVLGVALTGLVGGLHRRESATVARRELAASL